MNDIAFFEIFPWDKNFETGIAVIDEQHKRLVEILNQLAAHLANRSSAVKLNQIFDELADYADHHFKTEEKIWSTYFKDDEWFTRHELTHGSFISDVIALKNEQEDKLLDDVVQDVVSFLSKWLAYHILDTDKRMAKAVLAIEAGDSIEHAKVLANEEMNGSMQVLIDTVLTMYESISVRTLDLMREKTLRKQAEKELSLSEERWKFLLEGGAEGVWDWNIEQGQINTSKENASLFEIIGNKKQNKKIHPADIERMEADLQSHLDGKTEFFINKHRVLDENGSWLWVLSRGKVVSRDENGTALRMVGTHSDVTERELAALIYQKSSQAMFVTDRNNDIISINPAFTKVTGYCKEESVGKNPKFLASGKHKKEFYQQMWDAINSKGYWEGEIWNKRKNGELYLEALTVNAVIDDNGESDHHFALFSDITDKQKANETIFEQANFDSLTKLPNRHLFQNQLQLDINQSIRSGLPLALLFIDLDRFKEVNDTLGHDVGDILLIEAARRIKTCVREIDMVARLGGDEFTVILSELENKHSVERVTRQILHVLEQPFELEGNMVYVSASIGITLCPDDSSNMMTILKHADQAMYKAKEKGRNGYSYFTLSMQEMAQRRGQIIDNLRHAISADQLEVYYQPIVDLKTGDIHKAEALLRWRHPIEGLISPVDFIPLAEESGLIVEIGEWVFKQVAQQAKCWSEKYNTNFKISINKSPVQFLSILNHVNWVEYLAELGLTGKNIVIEMTEGLLLEDNEKLTNQLIYFRENGIEVALDDFGTGYSALAYLKKFDIDYLKIDRAFIQNLDLDSEDMALSEAIIVMAHKLGLKVIAEGVETEQQLQLLTEAECDYIQGYLISRPVPVMEFEKMLESRGER